MGFSTYIFIFSSLQVSWMNENFHNKRHETIICYKGRLPLYYTYIHHVNHKKNHPFFLTNKHLINNVTSVVPYTPKPPNHGNTEFNGTIGWVHLPGRHGWQPTAPYAAIPSLSLRPLLGRTAKAAEAAPHKHPLWRWMAGLGLPSCQGLR